MAKKYIKKQSYWLFTPLWKKVANINPEDFFYAFLLGISLVYGVLIWGIGEEIGKESKEIPVVTISSDTQFEKEIRSLVAGYPIERMAPYIARKDKKTAAFIIGIAKKESNWGVFTPKLAGEECYNYWGYRGQSERMTPGGYTCFSSPKEAVKVISARIDNLRTDFDRDTPERMVVWKCGYSCAGHSPEGVAKWISDVAYYYERVGI